MLPALNAQVRNPCAILIRLGRSFMFVHLLILPTSNCISPEHYAVPDLRFKAKIQSAS